MKAADRFLQRRRIAQARRWIRPGSRLLDVGTSDGALFAAAGDLLAGGVGIDPEPVPPPRADPRFELRAGFFPDAVGDGERYDAITMLAVVEHIETDELKKWAEAAYEHLTEGGRVVMTIPSPAVDTILHIGIRLRLLDGIEAHQHHGFRPDDVVPLFAGAGLTLEHRGRFQLGLNNLFVFRR